MLGGVSFNKMLCYRAHAVQHDDSDQQNGHVKSNCLPVGVGTCSAQEKIFSLAISLFLVEQLSKKPRFNTPEKAKLDPSFEDFGKRVVKNIVEPIRMRRAASRHASTMSVLDAVDGSSAGIVMCGIEISFDER